MIAEYLDEITPGALHPDDPLEKARHRSWIEFGSETLNAIGAFYNAPDEAAFEQKRQALRDRFERIEPQTAGPFFAGERFHMIDGVWGTVFRYLDTFDRIADFELLTDLPQISAWREVVTARPSVATAAPEGYPQRLERFLHARRSHLTTLVAKTA